MAGGAATRGWGIIRPVGGEAGWASLEFLSGGGVWWQRRRGELRKVRTGPSGRAEREGRSRDRSRGRLPDADGQDSWPEEDEFAGQGEMAAPPRFGGEDQRHRGANFRAGLTLLANYRSLGG